MQQSVSLSILNVNNPDNALDRIELFSRCREKMARELDSILESILPVIANDLELAAQQGKQSIDEQRQLYSAAATLRMEKRTRIAAAHAAFNERSLRCLEISIKDASSKQALSLLQEDELEVQILAADLAAWLREERPAVCLAFAKRIEHLTQRQWPNDDLQPLGPRTVGSAVGAALRSLARGGTVKLSIKNIAVTRLRISLSSLINDMNEELITLRVLPDWVPEIEKQAMRAEPAEMPDLPLPVVWQAGSTVSANAAPTSPVSTAAVAMPTTAQPVPIPAPTPTPTPATSASAPPAPAPAPAPEQIAPPAPAESSTSDSADYDQAKNAQANHAVNISALAADVSRKLDRSPLATVETASKLRVLPTLQPVLDIERDAVAFAHSIGTVPYSRESRREFFNNVRDRLRAASANSAQVATVEVVGAMFDYVVDDRRLPEPAKPLLWRLQQPTVALSLLDPGYLSNEPRSLRRLIENFGAIATAYSDEFVNGGELHRRLETVVRAVEIVSSALQTRSAVISQQVDREYGRAVRNVTKLVDRVVNERTTLESTPARQNRRDYRRRPDKQREIEVSEKLRLMLEERIGHHQIPDSAKDFILSVWLRHLRTAVLRDGEESTEFKLALEVVDDLLWSMETGARKQSRGALAKRIPPLIRMLTSGLREIGAREEEHKSFFDELFLLHLRKMRRDGLAQGETTEFSALSPLTSLPTLRDEIETQSSAGKKKVVDSPPTVPSFVPPDTTVIGNADKNTERDVTRSGQSDATSESPTRPRVSRTSSSRNRRSEIIPATIRKPDIVRKPDAATPNTKTTAPNIKTSAETPSELISSEINPVVPNTPNAQGTVDAPADDRGPEQKLLEVLHSLDLNDPPQSLDRLEIGIERLLETVDRGQWLALAGTDGITSIAKIAWVNSRRTVILLVRHPDRRALSLRMDELKRRAELGRAYLIAG